MNTESNSNQSSPETSDQESPKSVKLPEPDQDNITVLTHHLPNKPILPWNRYDSDWDETINNEEVTEEKLVSNEEE